MKVSKIAGMNLTAREVISVIGATCSPRTVSKARRGMPVARERIGWDNDVALGKDALANLEALHLKGEKIVERKGAEKQYFDALNVWRVAAKAEEINAPTDGSGDGPSDYSVNTIAAKTEAMKKRALAGNPPIPNALAKLDQKLCKKRLSLKKEKENV